MELTKKNLRNWLEAKDRNANVGLRGSLAACPLANFFLENKPNIDMVKIFPDTVVYVKVIGGTEQSKELPKWAKCFIEAVDFRLNFEEVTAGDALDMLRGV